MTENLLFGATLLLYLFAAVAFHIHVFAGADRARTAGTVLTAVGALLHLGAIGLWCINHRGESILRDPGMPFSLVAFFVAVVQAGLGLRARWASLGSLALPLAFVMQFYASTLASGSAGSTEHRSPLLNPHVMAILLGFASFTLAFCLALIYLAQSSLLKRKQLGGVFKRLPPLESVGEGAHWLTIIGFSLLTMSIVTGIIAAPEAWGSRWYLDGRIVASVVAWFVYAAYLTAYMALGWRGRRTIYFLIAGFIVVLIAFFANINSPKRADAGGVAIGTIARSSHRP